MQQPESNRENQTVVTLPSSVNSKLAHLDRARVDSLLSDALNSDLVTVVAAAGYLKFPADYSQVSQSPVRMR